MNDAVQTIPVSSLLFAFVPVAIVLMIMLSWSLRIWQAIYSLGRMVLQLVLIGYLLVFIFETEQSLVLLLVLTIMLVAAGWIALNPLAERRKELLGIVLLSLLVGAIPTLMVMTQIVLHLDPWFKPSVLIPLAGMALANAMNSLSLAAERYETELQRDGELSAARNTAFTTGMIPIINSLVAVGLVTLPGMMTGQILSGVSPLIAVRYQILVMCMMFGGSGITIAAYLWLRNR